MGKKIRGINNLTNTQLYIYYISLTALSLDEILMREMINHLSTSAIEATAAVWSAH